MSMEVETFAKLSPLDFQCGHVNYVRWECIDIAEAKLLREEKPEVYNALADGQGVVYLGDHLAQFGIT